PRLRYSLVPYTTLFRSHKEMTVMFVEAAQFRADDGYVYVRGQLLTDEKAVWVNIFRTTQRKWGYMLRSEQKAKIKEEIENMFEIDRKSTRLNSSHVKI